MPKGDNIGAKSILVMSPIYIVYDVTIRRFMYNQLHIFLEDRKFFLVRESLTRIYERCFKGLLCLVGDLMYLRHSWQNGENDRGL